MLIVFHKGMSLHEKRVINHVHVICSIEPYNHRKYKQSTLQSNFPAIHDILCMLRVWAFQEPYLATTHSPVQYPKK